MRGTATAGRRAQRRKAQARLSREQILDAAEEVFARKGFHATTLKEIAELAEFSVGSVYSFFSSKEALFSEIFNRRGAEFVPGMRAVLTNAQPPRAQLHQLADFQIGFFREHAHFGRLFLRESGLTNLRLGPAPDAEGHERFIEAMSLQAELFLRGQQSGDLRPGNAEVLSGLFSGIISAYQGFDTLGADGSDGHGEHLALSDLHAILDDAFGAGTP